MEMFGIDSPVIGQRPMVQHAEVRLHIDQHITQFQEFSPDRLDIFLIEPAPPGHLAHELHGYLEPSAILAAERQLIECRQASLPPEAVPVSKLESGAHWPASELAEAERKPG